MAKNSESNETDEFGGNISFGLLLFWVTDKQVTKVRVVVSRILGLFLTCIYNCK